MKSFRVLVLLALCCGAAPVALWAEDAAEEKKHHGTEHATEVQEAHENEGRGGIFTRTGDWFATVGRSEERKQEIRAERHARRAERRASREAKAQERSRGKDAEGKHGEHMNSGEGEHGQKHDQLHGEGKHGENHDRKHGEGHGEQKMSGEPEHGEKHGQGHGAGHGDADSDD